MKEGKKVLEEKWEVWKGEEEKGMRELGEKKIKDEIWIYGYGEEEIIRKV